VIATSVPLAGKLVFARASPRLRRSGRPHKGVFEQGAAYRSARYTDSAVQAGEPMTAKVLTGRAVQGCPVANSTQSLTPQTPHIRGALRAPVFLADRTVLGGFAPGRSTGARSATLHGTV